MLGDFYVSFGRGMVLSIRKIDELGIDTTLLGGKFVYHEGNRVAATLVARRHQHAERRRGDRPTSRDPPESTFLRPVPAPRDFIGGARVEYRFFDQVDRRVHEVGGVQAHNADPHPAACIPTRMFMYGGSLDAPQLTRWLGALLRGGGAAA